MNVVRWKVFGLSPYIRKESIRMAGDGSFTIISVQHQNVTIFPILISTGFKVLRCLRMLQQRLYMAHVGSNKGAYYCSGKRKDLILLIS